MRFARKVAPARTVALFGGVALLLLGPTTAVAQADPVPQLPADLSHALHRDLGLNVEQYLERSEVAQRLAGFAATARAQFPDAFAGSWLDDHGRPVVGLAGPNADAARDAVAAAGFDVRDVARSEASLDGQLAAFRDWLRGQPVEVADLVRSAAVDLLNNTLTIRVQDAAALPLPGFFDSLTPRVLITPSAQPLPAQATDIADPGSSGPLEAGVGYSAVTDDLLSRCSLGFNGVDGAGRVVNISAGHCDPNLPAAGTPNASAVYLPAPFDGLGPRIGAFNKTVLDRHDYSLIGIDAAMASRFENNLVRVPDRAPLALDGVARPVVGAPVCKSGSRTGFTCGTINSTGQSVQVGARTLDDGFSTTICALPGDSGGALVTGTKALGIASASSVADAPFCALPELIGAITGATPVLFATTLDAVLADNPGLRVRTS